MRSLLSDAGSRAEERKVVVQTNRKVVENVLKLKHHYEAARSLSLGSGIIVVFVTL